MPHCNLKSQLGVIETFAMAGGKVVSEFLDLAHTSNSKVTNVPYHSEVRYRAKPQTEANFEIGTLVDVTSNRYSSSRGNSRITGMISLKTLLGRLALWQAVIIIGFVSSLSAGIGARDVRAQSAERQALAKLTPAQRKTLKTYQAARRSYERKLDAYWRQVDLKRKQRRSRAAKGHAITAQDYVQTQPPAYAGPSRPNEIYALLPQPPKPKTPPRSTIPIVEDFLREAKEQYAFVPDTVTEDEFMIYYAIEAMKLGLTRDQVVRVFALETGGMGTHDLQSGYNPKTKRAASTALGYAQLLAANSIGQIRKHGAEFAERLDRLASEQGLEPEKALRFREKARVLRKMRADALRIPEKWSVYVDFSKKPKGLAMHAMNLDGDIGPWMQVTKLKSIKAFAARKGMTVLSGSQLELMNLAGPGRGFEMMQNIARDMPTANFFDRGGYERNPVVHNRTGAQLLARLDEIMDRNLEKSGAKQFAYIFDALLRQTAGTSRAGEPIQASAGP